MNRRQKGSYRFSSPGAQIALHIQLVFLHLNNRRPDSPPLCCGAGPARLQRKQPTSVAPHQSKHRGAAAAEPCTVTFSASEQRKGIPISEGATHRETTGNVRIFWTFTGCVLIYQKKTGIFGSGALRTAILLTPNLYRPLLTRYCEHRSVCKVLGMLPMSCVTLWL